MTADSTLAGYAVDYHRDEGDWPTCWQPARSLSEIYEHLGEVERLYPWCVRVVAWCERWSTRDGSRRVVRSVVAEWRREPLGEFTRHA